MKSKNKPGSRSVILTGVFLSCLLVSAQADEVADFSSRLNVEYERPDADYSKYNSLLIKPLDVSETRIISPPWVAEKPFRWEVSDNGIARLQDEFMASMNDQISGNGGYALVTESAPGVMELYVKIVSFMPYAERKDRVTTRGSGEMVIHAETRDAQTGELLGIYEGPQEVGKNYQPNTDFTRAKNLKKLFDSWGRRVRVSMDEDHGR